MNDEQQQADRGEVWRTIRSRFPGLREALLADARATAAGRGERFEFRSPLDATLQILRLMWVSDAFLAQALYRLKARLQVLGVPVLPRLAHRLAMAIAQVSIGDPVIVHPGVYILHGQVVMDGLVEIHAGAVIGPWVTIGLRAGNLVGPTVEHDVHIGTGAKLIGPVQVGHGAQIGANAVVVNDVPAGATVVGAPARAVGESADRTSSDAPAGQCGETQGG
jgi:serine O-acetyltransferase